TERTRPERPGSAGGAAGGGTGAGARGRRSSAGTSWVGRPRPQPALEDVRRGPRILVRRAAGFPGAPSGQPLVVKLDGNARGLRDSPGERPRCGRLGTLLAPERQRQA